MFCEALLCVSSVFINLSGRPHLKLLLLYICQRLMQSEFKALLNNASPNLTFPVSQNIALLQNWLQHGLLVESNRVYSVRQNPLTQTVFLQSLLHCSVCLALLKSFLWLFRWAKEGHYNFSKPLAESFTLSIGLIFHCLHCPGCSCQGTEVPLSLAGCSTCIAWQILFQVEELFPFQRVWLMKGYFSQHCVLLDFVDADVSVSV